MFHGGEILPTNRISFSLKSVYTRQSLDPLLGGDAVFDSTIRGTLQIKLVKQDGNVFDVANRVYESRLVEYCSPDFLANIDPQGAQIESSSPFYRLGSSPKR
jgi:hypothetical protein